MLYLFFMDFFLFSIVLGNWSNLVEARDVLYLSVGTFPSVHNKIMADLYKSNLQTGAFWISV